MVTATAFFRRISASDFRKSSAKLKTSFMATLLILSMGGSLRVLGQEAYDVVIVGGGISGAYSMNRLKKQYPEWKIKLIEQNKSIGGRLLSVDSESPTDDTDGYPNTGEMGGMRFFPQVTPLTAGLADELGMKSEIIPYKSDENIVYYKGKHYKVSEIQAITTPLIEKVYQKVLESGDQNCDSPNVTGQSCQEAFSRYLTPEEFDLVKRTSGYNNGFEEESIGPVIKEDKVLNSDDPQRMFVDGFQEMPRRLMKGISSDQVELNTKVTAIGRDEASGMNFVQLDSGEKLLTKKIVLTIKKQAIKTLLGGKLPPALDEVVEVKAFKMAMEFDDPFWKTQCRLGPLERGRTTTDLPVKQVWYFGPKTLLIYSDGKDAEYWMNYLANDKETPRAKWIDAEQMSKPMLDDVCQQLAQVHDLKAIPRPKRVVLKDWADGGWHSWLPGEPVLKRFERTFTPIPENKDVIVCGETYAPLLQGWVEGTLTDVAYMLDKQFKVKAPKAVYDHLGRQAEENEK